MGVSAPNPWGTVIIVRNAVGHRPPLDLVMKHVESDIVCALVMTTAGGYTPELPYITHSHSSRCSVCTEYGAHLALASAAQLRTYQRACYDLVHLQDHLLQCRSVEDIDRMLHHAGADNEDLRLDNVCLQEENNKLKARLTSMSPLQPQSSMADGPYCNGCIFYLILSRASILSNHSACLISLLYLRLWLSQ